MVKKTSQPGKIKLNDKLRRSLTKIIGEVEGIRTLMGKSSNPENPGRRAVITPDREDIKLYDGIGQIHTTYIDGEGHLYDLTISYNRRRI